MPGASAARADPPRRPRQGLHKAGELDALRTDLQAEDEHLYTGLVEELTETYPVFWDAEREEFTGPVSTNAVEGRNWRLKYGLRPLRAV